MMFSALLAVTCGLLCALGAVILGRIVEHREARDEIAEARETAAANHDAWVQGYKHLAEGYRGLAEQHRALLKTVQPRLANGRFGRLPRATSNSGETIG